jgi:hypothetical protein
MTIHKEEDEEGNWKQDIRDNKHTQEDIEDKGNVLHFSALQYTTPHCVVQNN